MTKRAIAFLSFLFIASSGSRKSRRPSSMKEGRLLFLRALSGKTGSGQWLS
jgi:hypothetical protein